MCVAKVLTVFETDIKKLKPKMTNLERNKIKI